MKANDFRRVARENLKDKWKSAFIFSLIFTAIIFFLSFLEALSEDVALNLILSITSLVLTVPLGYGFLVSMLNLKKGKAQTYPDYFKFSFSNFKRSWAITGRTIQKMLLPFILMIISIFILMYALLRLAMLGFFIAVEYNSIAITPTINSLFILSIGALVLYIVSICMFIPKFYLYTLAYPIAIDNPDLTAKEAVEKSAELMNGYRWKLFCLFLSFIGWLFLTAIIYTLLLDISLLLGIISFFALYCFLLPYIMQSYIAFYENRINPQEESKEETQNETGI